MMFSSWLAGCEVRRVALGMVDTVQVGLIPRILQQLFVSLGATHGEANNPGLRCSYIEVYNEMVKDLLSPVGTVTRRDSSLPRARDMG